MGRKRTTIDHEVNTRVMESAAPPQGAAVAGVVRPLALLFTVSVIGCALFVVLTAIAMLFYPGGTGVDRTTTGYSFTLNAFSDLGMTRSFSGGRNLVSMALFVVGLCAGGAGLITFFTAFAKLFPTTRYVGIAARAASYAGVLAGLAFIGVALVPADLNFQRHLFFVLMAFRFFTLAAIASVVCLLGSTTLPRVYAYLFLAFTVLLFGYLRILGLVSSAGTREAVLLQVIGQKVIAYSSVIVVMIVALRCRKAAGE
jgi:hypothetical protein